MLKKFFNRLFAPPQSYYEYLKSDKWHKRATRIKQFQKSHCGRCGKKTKIGNVHHIHYENIFNEYDKDLVYLCRKCHVEIHEEYPRGSKRYGYNKDFPYRHKYKA